jgi:N-methylhydantoinase B/oxoprolinase/acetone carboxylase alpha subunit
MLILPLSAVKYQIQHLGIGPDAPSGHGIVDGDVIMTNSPKAGGSHLPDITVSGGSCRVTYHQHVLRKKIIRSYRQSLTNRQGSSSSWQPAEDIMPVRRRNDSRFFYFADGWDGYVVADIGGILPGSMPPSSTTIFEEGARVHSFKVVSRGVYNRAELLKQLVDDPASYPGSSGSRCVQDVESDLKAQIAANRKGISLIYACERCQGEHALCVFF